MKGESGAPLRQEQEQVEVKSKLCHKRPREWQEGSGRKEIFSEPDRVSEDDNTSAEGSASLSLAAGTKSSVIVFPRKCTKDGPHEGVIELTVDSLRLYFRCPHARIGVSA